MKFYYEQKTKELGDFQNLRVLFLDLRVLCALVVNELIDPPLHHCLRIR